MQEIDNINRFLDECGTFTVITTINGLGTGRPFSFHKLKDGKLCFCVGKFKDAYKQMEALNFVEIVSYRDNNWMRYSGDAVFFQDAQLFEDLMEHLPILENLYNSPEDVAFFYLENATVEYHVQWDLKHTAELK